MTTAINSRRYWDDRFSDDWIDCDGPRQSRFFAHVAIECLPPWLLHQMKAQRLSFADWGCAQGDGTDAWARCLAVGQITGVDFSAVAIEEAVRRYPAIRFVHADWLAGDHVGPETFDVVFSSNVLEHFADPFGVLRDISTRANKAVVLALPYQETERIEEHFSAFYAENLPVRLQNGFRLAWAKVADCSSLPGTCWAGHQVVLVYAAPEWTDTLGLVLGECRVEADDGSARLRALEQRLAARDGEDANLARAVARCTDQVIDLTQALDSRDADIAALREEIDEREGRIARLSAELDARAGDMAALRREVDDLDGRCARLTGELDARNVEIAALRLLVDQRDSRITRLSGERDAHIERLAAERAELDRATRQLTAFRDSKSWRLTRPLRSLRRLLRSPRQELAHAAGIARRRWDRATQRGGMPRRDLSWSEFQSRVLARRDAFKGVFIQAAVIDWNVTLYQRPQHLAAALGRLGILVLYRTRNEFDDVRGFREVEPNVWVTDCQEIDHLDGAVRSFYSTGYMDQLGQLMDWAEGNVLVYEYIDHIDPKISGDEHIGKLAMLKDWAFGGGVDYVVASARLLRDEAVEAVGEGRVLFAQNGVDVQHYRSAAHATAPLPADLLAFRQRHRNVVGYFGAIAPWLWYDVLDELVAARPDLGFVFIGPDYYGGLGKLPKARNVLHCGSVDYKVLPAYARTFDVCIIPFEPGEIARTTSPLKLFEYFALEKPVVVTSDMVECLAYDEVFHGDSAASFARAIDAALRVKDDASFRARLARLADHNTWDCRARALAPAFAAVERKRGRVDGARR